MPIKTFATLTLLGVALAAPRVAGAAQLRRVAPQADTMRFREMDRNADGAITREEWRGTVASFAVQDWNADGVLSGDEVRIGGRRDGNFANQDFDPSTAGRFTLWNEAAFAQLDHNRDGRISANEWHYDLPLFRRADRNGDSSLTLAEFLGPNADDGRDDQFDHLDINSNDRIERKEWHASTDAFTWLDRNRDGVLSRAEVEGTQPSRGRGRGRNRATDQAADVTGDQFVSLDYNRDGRVTPDEWHWSRSSFDQLDRNRDGILSRAEMYASATGAVGTSGQVVRVNPTLRWNDTGLYVTAGQTVTVSADGTIQMSLPDTGDNATPAGARSGRRAEYSPLPAQSAGALIAQVGNSSPILVGNQSSFRAPVSGRLYLGVNDDHLPDNSGEYRATITIQ